MNSDAELADVRQIVVSRLAPLQARVYLFGSRASGSAHLSSDVDVGVLPLLPFEAVWKAAQQFLREHEGLDAASPKGTVRPSLAARVISDVDARLALQMVDDRNLKGRGRR